jgi:putative acetyltransferase
MIDPDDVVLRLIRPEDDPSVADIIRTVMTEHGAVGSGFAIVDPEVSCMSQAYAETSDPPARYFVIEQGGEVIGGAGFAPLVGGDPGVCELRKMYLRPKVRGAGLGRRLLAHVLAHARAAGYARCYLETMATMQRARALYESVGFERLPCALGATGHYGCDAWYARDL